MATLTARLGSPMTEAHATLRRAAAGDGWALDENATTARVIVLTKGVTPTSWGARITLRLEPHTEASTRVVASTGETWAFTDWGRGRRAVRRLFAAAGAAAA